MPRPKKWRRVCEMPKSEAYGPICPKLTQENRIEMLVEEFEVIRLMDYEGLTQEECAQRIGVARTTVQRMYTEARQKIAKSLVEGRVLVVMGGDYKICSTEKSLGGCGYCKKKIK